MSINLEKETKKISGKYIYIDDAKKDYIQNISLEGDIQQNAIVEVPGTTVTGETICVTDVDTTKEHEINIKGNISQEIIEEEKGTTLEGESVVISDGDINKEVKAIINGNSYQETTEGYNLLDTSNYVTRDSLINLTVKRQSDGSFIINGTTDENGADIRITSEKPIITLKAGTHTFYFVDIEKSTMFNCEMNLNMYGLGTYTLIKRIAEDIKYKELTLTEDLEIYNINYHLTTSATFNNFVLKPMIYEGTYDVNKPYEPYTNGASPNTEYEQDIEVVDGVNRLNLPDYTETKNGVTVTVKNGEVSMSGTPTAVTSFYIPITDINLKTTDIYSVSLNSNKSGFDGFGRYLTDIDKNLIKWTYGMAGLKEETGFSPTSDTVAKYFHIALNTVGVDYTGLNYKPMLVEGASEKPYLPYGHIGLVQRGKNVFKTSKCEFNPNNASIETSTDNEIVEKSYGAWSRIECTINGLKPNTNYIISSNIFNPSGAFCGFHVGGGKTVLSKETNFSAKISSETNDNGIFYVEFYNNYSSTGINNLIVTYTNIQLEEGTVATDYAPYQEIVHSIDLAGNTLAKVGDIKDILNIGVDGSVSIEKKIFKVPFSDLMVSLVKDMNETVTRIVAYTNTEHIEKTNLLSNYFRYLNDRWNDNPVTPNIIYGWENTLSYGIHISTDLGITTLEKAKTFLDSLENGYLYARLLNAETIPLPSIEPIELFEGTNIFELVTNLGTTASMTYDYVTPSPSVRRLSEIKTPVGKQSVVVGNKNLFDINNITENLFLDGADVNNTGSSSVTDTSNYIRVYENIPVTVSMKYETLLNENGRGSVFYDLNKKPISGQNYIITNIMEKPFTITPSQDGYFRFSYDKNCYDIQVEIGDIATAYTPHQSQTYAISLGTMELAKIGNYQDHIVKRSNKWYKYKAIKKYKITGGESIALIATSDYGYRFVIYDIVDAISNAEIYCNAFRWREEYNTNNRFNVNTINEDLIHLRDANNGIGLWVRKEHYITSIEELKTYFTNNNIYVYYPLAKPIYEEITDTNLIAELDAMEKSNLYQGITNIYTISDFNPELELHYNFITPSPSIDSPAEIITVKGKQSFYAGNKNLCKSFYVGDTVIYHDCLFVDFDIKPSTTYKVSGKATPKNSYYLDTTSKTIIAKYNSITVKDDGTFIMTITTKDVFTGQEYDKNRGYIIFKNNIANATHNFTDIQIEEGTVATEYVEHQSQVQDLDLTSELLGTIVDKEDGSYFENRWKREVFDGSEVWNVSSYSTDEYLCAYNLVNNIKQNSKITYCNYFPQGVYTNTSTKECIVNNELSLNIKILVSRLKENSVTGLQTFLKELYDNGTPLEVLYQLATPTYTKLTDEQQAQWNKIKKMHTYEGVTNIYTINENGISPVLNLEYTTKYAEEYDFYIDENARFIVPEYGINYQVSMTESDLSDMPEASESAVKIAGKDGDVVLNTTYEPKDFNIVAYTDDNLEPKDKEAEKTKLVNFLHSIKNRTKNFGLLYREKFYPVKYNDKLTPTIYPKSIRFEIPIKSSKSLGYALEKKMIFGNGKEISNTIEETGCKIIIEGPIYGTNDSPMVITLNDYQMAYYNTVLEGNRLEIDTNNSTIKHISSNGEVTNVAAYYNHEYPKIKYGENEIKILSKIDSETQVYTEWYDLKI